MFTLTVDIDPSALIAALERLPATLNGQREPMKSALADASRTLMRWEHAKFIAHSGGDGTWAPLKPRTKEARLRRQAKAAGMKIGGSARYIAAQSPMFILRDTETLEYALFERASNGHFIDFDADGVTEGTRGGSHPNASISVGELAFAHHYGVPAHNLPARPVLGEPDGKILAELNVDLSGGLTAAFADLAAGITGRAA